MSSTDLPAVIQAHDEAAMNPPDNRPPLMASEPEPQQVAFAEVTGVGSEDDEGAWLTIDKSAVIDMDL